MAKTRVIAFLFVTAVVLQSVSYLEVNAQKVRQVRQAIQANVLDVILEYAGLTAATAALDVKANEEAAAYGVVVQKGEALAAAQAEFDTATADWEAAKVETDQANQAVQDELEALRPLEGK